MKHELGLPFPPRNLPIKFGTNPSTIFLVIVVTDRHTDKATPVKNILPRFCGENNDPVFAECLKVRGYRGAAVSGTD